MSKFDPNATSVADAYARTLLSLCQRQGNAERVAEEFADWVALLERDRSFAEFMTSAAVDVDDRRRVLEKCFRGKLDDVLLSTLQVINRRSRCALIPLIQSRFQHWYHAFLNEVEVQVTSAVALTDSLRDRLRDAVGSMTGKTPRVVEKVDASLLGGLVIRIGDKKLDGSVRRQLRLIYERLHDRASAELHAGRQHYEVAGA